MVLNTMKKSDVEKVRRPANYHDRLCDKCGFPMIGIMKISGRGTPRRVCHSCGGKPTEPEERLK